MYMNQAKVNFFRERSAHRLRGVFRATPNSGKIEVIQLSNAATETENSTRLIENSSHLEQLTNNVESSRLFIMRQQTTWARLNISQDLFQHFVNAFDIFPEIWKSVYALGFKLKENESLFPGPYSKFARTMKGGFKCELSYILRRVERHGRAPEKGVSPWSIRQTAVYHQAKSRDDVEHSTSTYLLVSPSSTFEEELAGLLQSSCQEELNPWMIHWLLVVDSARGWPEYVAWLEDEIQEMSVPILIASVGDQDQYNEKDLTNYKFKFEDRQDLKKYEDYILNLQMILDTMLDNTTGIHGMCQKWCTEHCCNSNNRLCDCLNILEELDAYITEVKINMQRLAFLKAKLESTIRLLTDLLSYEGASALQNLAEESQEEGHVMSLLALQSAKDAASVKVLTVISLIYLPFTIIANFFSTEFVKAQDEKMEISPQAWILFAVAVPLTVLTVGFWWLCVRYVTPVQQKYPNDPPRGRKERSKVWEVVLRKDCRDLEDGVRTRKRKPHQIPPRRDGAGENSNHPGDASQFSTGTM